MSFLALCGNLIDDTRFNIWVGCTDGWGQSSITTMTFRMLPGISERKIVIGVWLNAKPA